MVKITFEPLPTANAGTYDPICEDDTFTTDQATATNYSNVTWTTTGDGDLDNITSLTECTYEPGTNDKAVGSFYLTLIVEPDNAYCCAVSSTLTVTILPQFTTGEIATTGLTICYNTAASEIGSTTAASSGDGVITYSWRSSGDDYAAAIDGADQATYTPGSLTQTTSFRRYAKDASCNITPVESVGTWSVTVEPTPASGTLAKHPDQVSVDMGATVSATLTPGSGGNGNDEMQYRTHNGTIWSSWENYTSGDEISSFLKTQIEIRTRRMADFCDPSDDVTVGWVVEQTSVLNVNEGFVYYFIQHAIDAASDGDIIRIGTNTYPENVNTSGKGGLTLQPGFSQGEVTVTGTFTFSDGDVLEIELFGDEEYDKFIIQDVANINGASLDIYVMGTFKPAPGTRFTIINSPNDPGKFSNPSLIEANSHYFILSYEQEGSSWNFVLTAVAQLFKMEIQQVGNR
jgi:hypothetical protein